MDYKDQEFQDFLNEHKALSQSELAGLNFPRENFKKPRSPGVYIGALVAKEWGRNMSLISYFEVGEGFIDLVKFVTYRNSAGIYMPLQGEIGLENLDVGMSAILYLERNEDKIFLAKLKPGNIKTIFIDQLNNIL